MSESFWKIFLLLIVVNFAIYYNSLSNGFVFDDHLGIVNNADLSSTTPYSEIWRHDFWGKSLSKVDSHRSYRPLMTTVFKLSSTYFGLQPTPIRILAIAAHTVCSVLVFLISNVIGNMWDVSLVASLLFASHPVHVEAVAAVVNMAEPACGIFYLLAFLIYRIAVTKTHYSLLFHISVAVIWLIVVIASILFKETGVTQIGLVFALSFLDIYKSYFFLQNNCSINLTLLYFLFAILIGIWYLLMRKLLSTIDMVEMFRTESDIYSIVSQIYQTLISSQATIFLENSELIRKAENPFTFLIGFNKILSYIYLHFRYFYLLVYPMELCSEYAFNCIPSISNFTDPRIILPFILYVSMFFIVIKCFVNLREIGKDEKRLKRERNLNESTTSHLQNIDKNISKTTYEANITEDEDLTSITSVEFSIVGTTETHTRHDGSSSINVSPSTCGLKTQSSETLATVVMSEHVHDSHVLATASIETCQPNFKNLIDSDKSHSEIVLISMALMVIPFLPVSGVLRIGTLLAERLLYLPSVGYCILLSLALKVLARRQSFYICASIMLVTAFSIRVVLRNPSWKDDKTLFMDSYKTCPSSAKLNLQLTKLYLNEGDIMNAKIHLERAKQIDPSFCDAGYQEALIAVVENEGVKAVDAALNNLKCIFTSMHSFELLSAIWQSQLQESPRSVALYDDIGDKCVTHGLAAAGVIKFITGSQLALDQKLYSKAMQMSMKAERVFSKLEADNAFEKGLACAVYSNAGRIRHSLRDAKHIKGIKKERELTEHFLLKAIDPSCSVMDGQSRDFSVKSILAMHALADRYDEEYSSFKSSTVSDVSSGAIDGFMRDYLRICHLSLKSLANTIQMFKKKLLTSKKISLKDLGNYYKVFYGNAYLLAVAIAQALFTASNYVEADIFFTQVFQTYETTLAMDIKENDIQINPIDCSVYFWHAHTKAGLPGFVDERREIVKVMKLLERGRQCAGSIAKFAEESEAALTSIHELSSFISSKFEGKHSK